MYFPPNSRYYLIETATYKAPDEKEYLYLKRRWIPQPEHFSLMQEHLVVEGDRLDNIAAHYLNDPEQFWRICDANRAMRPDALTEEPGRWIRITLPEGIPGTRNV